MQVSGWGFAGQADGLMLVSQDVTSLPLVQRLSQMLQQHGSFLLGKGTQLRNSASAAVLEAAAQRQQQAQQDADMADAEGADAAGDKQLEQQQAAAGAEAAAKAQAARQLVLAQVRGFSMAFRSQVVELGLTQSIVQAVEALGLDPELKAALLAPFVLA